MKNATASNDQQTFEHIPIDLKTGHESYPLKDEDLMTQVIWKLRKNDIVTTKNLNIPILAWSVHFNGGTGQHQTMLIEMRDWEIVRYNVQTITICSLAAELREIQKTIKVCAVS